MEIYKGFRVWVRNKGGNRGLGIVYKVIDSVIDLYTVIYSVKVIIIKVKAFRGQPKLETDIVKRRIA